MPMPNRQTNRKKNRMILGIGLIWAFVGIWSLAFGVFNRS
jgi:hypothetical protein